MNKKFTLLLAVLLLTVAGFAQISVGAFGNYTMYKGDFKKSTPGVGLEVGYNLMAEGGGSLSFTKGFAIKQAATITSDNGAGSTKTTASEISTSFSTISFTAQYRFFGKEEGFAFLGRGGTSYVMASTKETEKEAIPAGYTAMDKMEDQKDNGFTLNLGLGAQYKFGLPTVFFNGGVALPTNNVNNTLVANYIPLHYSFNLGARISFGKADE